MLIRSLSLMTNDESLRSMLEFLDHPFWISSEDSWCAFK